jgi:hypothetical protein
MSSEILQRQFELLGLAAEQDLDYDGRVQVHGDVVGRRHDRRVRLAMRVRVVVRATAASLPPLYRRSRDAATSMLLLLSKLVDGVELKAEVEQVRRRKQLEV